MLRRQQRIPNKMEYEFKKNFFGYFLMFFPTILIAGIPSNINGDIFLPMVLKLLIASYQFIVIKNFVDRYYGDSPS
jgi:hypothetical protein